MTKTLTQLALRWANSIIINWKEDRARKGLWMTSRFTVFYFRSIFSLSWTSAIRCIKPRPAFQLTFNQQVLLLFKLLGAGCFHSMNHCSTFAMTAIEDHNLTNCPRVHASPPQMLNYFLFQKPKQISGLFLKALIYCVFIKCDRSLQLWGARFSSTSTHPVQAGLCQANAPCVYMRLR